MSWRTTEKLLSFFLKLVPFVPVADSFTNPICFCSSSLQTLYFLGCVSGYHCCWSGLVFWFCLLETVWVGLCSPSIANCWLQSSILLWSSSAVLDPLSSEMLGSPPQSLPQSLKGFSSISAACKNRKLVKHRKYVAGDLHRSLKSKQQQLLAGVTGRAWWGKSGWDRWFHVKMEVHMKQHNLVKTETQREKSQNQ